MERLAEYAAVILDPGHLRRTTGIALVVGTWLTVYNQGMIGTFAIEPSVAVAVALNYLTPFVVANWGLVARQSGAN